MYANPYAYEQKAKYSVSDSSLREVFGKSCGMNSMPDCGKNDKVRCMYGVCRMICKTIYRTPKNDTRLLWACSHVNASVPKYEAQMGILLLLFCFGMSSSPPALAAPVLVSNSLSLSLSLPPSLPPCLSVSLSLCLSVSLSLSLCVSVSMHPEAEEGFKELSKISDRETWPGTILKRHQNDNRNNGKVVICEYLAIPFSSYSRKMESYVRCATCSRKASGQLPLVRSCVTGPSQSVGGRLKSFQPS